jgi:hypothetical protein
MNLDFTSQMEICNFIMETNPLIIFKEINVC